jgi:hypothetical protein
MAKKVGRKSFIIGVALVLPMSMIALVGVSGGTAGAKAVPPDPPVTCSLTGTIDFGYPGLSKDGSVAAIGGPYNSIMSGPVGGPGCVVESGKGSWSGNPFFQEVKCDKHTPGLPASNPACQPHLYGSLSWGDFTSGAITSAIQKYSKSHFGFEFIINGNLYIDHSTSSSTILAGGLCGNSQIGFQIVGSIHAPKQDKKQPITITDCLGAITGTGLDPGDNFYDASVDQVGVVSTVAIDPATSSVHIG